MSLQTDAIFIKALQQNADITAVVGDQIYSTAIPLPEEDAENVDVPYIIVTYDGMQNDDFTKDCSYEGASDKVQIGVTIVAGSRPDLAELAELVRATISTYLENIEQSDEDYDLVPNDYTLTAQAVQYDDLKPCYWQVLNYNCDTNV